MPKAVNGWKVCSKCREKKLVSEFNKAAHTSDGFCYQCSTCLQAYREEHREEARAYSQARYEKRRAELLAQSAVNYQVHREEILAQHKVYRATEAGQATTQRAERKRRALERGAISDLTPGDFVLLEARHPVCTYCGHSFSENGGPFRRTLDHIVPYSRGGSNTLDNVVFACRRCNSQKGIKLPEEWIRRWYEREGAQ